MKDSASRREAKPRSAMIFWRRMGASVSVSLGIAFGLVCFLGEVDFLGVVVLFGIFMVGWSYVIRVIVMYDCLYFSVWIRLIWLDCFVWSRIVLLG